jgi:hypothetical protein
MEPRQQYASYMSSSSVMSEGVYQFLTGCIFGAIGGMVTPFPPRGRSSMLPNDMSGVFRPAAPFSAWSSIPSYAIVCGSLFGVQRLSSKSMELMRRQQDIWNEFFGYVVTYQYYSFFIGSTSQRFNRHNRFVGGAFLLTVLYANILL